MASVQKVENKINMIVFQSEGITMVMCGRALEPPALPRSRLRSQHRPTHRTAALAQPWGAASWPLVFPVAVGLPLSPLPVASPFRPSSASHGWTHCSDPCCLGLSLPSCSKASPGHCHSTGCESFVLAFVSWLPHKLHKIRGLICPSQCL